MLTKEQKELAKVIENYFGADAGYLDISCLDLARTIAEAGWSKPEWISVKDRLPEKNEFDWVLVVVELHSQYGIFHSVPIVAELRHGEWYDYNDKTIESEFEKVTHWMPLPQPPKGE